MVGAALLAGLVGSPHCAGMCGGLAAAVGDTRLWHAGRLTTYALLGVGAASLGSQVPGPAWAPSAVAAVMMVPLSLSLAGWLPKVPVPKLLVRAGATALNRGHRFLFGLVTGLLPCGLVYAALGLAVAAGSPAEGAITMLAFGAGTLPGLVLLSTALRKLLRRAPRWRPAIAGLVLVMGLGTLAWRVPPSADAAPTCHSETP